MPGCTPLKVAGAQMPVHESIEHAAEDILLTMRRAAKKGARHLVVPEMILTGYHDKWDQDERDRAVNGLIRPACRDLGITLHLGAGNRRNRSGKLMKKPFIQVCIIGPDGKIIGVHNKTLPTDGDLQWCLRGRPRDLRTHTLAGLTFGNTICNDFWANPNCTTLKDINIPLILGRKGAKVIFHSIASGHDLKFLDFHTTRMEDRAVRSGAWVVTANHVADSKKPVNAPSGIVAPDGRWRFKAPLKGRCLYVQEISV